ncbi:reelin-like [Arapaima gigas]
MVGNPNRTRSLQPYTEIITHPVVNTTSLTDGVMPERQFGTQFVCSVVASHVSHQPSTSFSFVWIAPPPGTGCINFLEGVVFRFYVAPEREAIVGVRSFPVKPSVPSESSLGPCSLVGALGAREVALGPSEL